MGAGFAGMAASHFLDNAGMEVTLIESSSRAGGLIGTTQTPYGLAEWAANSILATGPIRELCKDIGTELVPVREDSKARYIYRAGRVRKFPLGTGAVLGLLGRALYLPADRNRDPALLTLEDWASRFLGRQALDYLLSPMVRGVYGAEPAEISVAAAFPKLVVPKGHSLASHFLNRAIHGSKKKEERSRMMAPAQGMGELVRALDTHLTQRLGSRFKKGAKMDALPEVENLILTVPAYEAARLLEPMDSQLASALREVRYAPLISVTAFVRIKDPAARPHGVGVLFPAVEKRDALGILFSSSSFPGRVTDEASLASFTVMLGGTSRPDLLKASDAAIGEIVRRELKEVLRQDDVVHLEIHRHERAVPLYDLKLVEAWNAARSGWCSRPGRILFGNYAGQVSIRGMAESAHGLAAGLQSP